MAKKTRVIHGWCYDDETIEELFVVLDDVPLDDVLFTKQEYAKHGKDIKRMTIRITIEDYSPSRKENKK